MRCGRSNIARKLPLTIGIVPLGYQLRRSQAHVELVAHRILGTNLNWIGPGGFGTQTLGAGLDN